MKKCFLVLTKIYDYIVPIIFGLLIILYYYKNIDIFNKKETSLYGYIPLILGIIIFFMPQFKKIKLGKYIELERKVEETNKELKEYKEFVNNNISILTSMINVSNSLNSSINNVSYTIPYVPNSDELKNILNEIENKRSKGYVLEVNKKSEANILKNSKYIKEEVVEKENDVFNRLNSIKDEKILQLIDLRITIEQKLRAFYNKNINICEDNTFINRKVVSTNNLMKFYVNMNPQKSYLINALREIYPTLNMAVHGIEINKNTMDLCISIGENIINDI